MGDLCGQLSIEQCNFLYLIWQNKMVVVVVVS